MLPSTIDVEYIVRKQRKHSDLPAEFRDLPVKLPEKHPVRQSRFLLFVAETMIRAGNAIKNSQVKVSRQNIYS